MSVFDSYNRDQLRRSYAEAWAKSRARLPLTPLDAAIADVINVHPEYQPVVRNADEAVSYAPSASGDAENPFLHMGLHLAVRDQVSVDRPPGIRQVHALLQAQYGDVHRAEHAMMEALGETLWQAQRSGSAPDEQQYLARLRQRLKSGGP
jgi:Domain of unknown function (DUF1841)